MSALTDFFTSLANKIRTKLGTSTTYTPAQAVSAIDDVYTKGVTDTKKGNSAVGDVKSGKTFTSVNGVNLTGTFAAQEKTVTAGTSAASVTPDSGKYLSKVTYNPTPSQSKSASPSTSAQTISPDSGKLLSSVSISAISPQRSAGTAAVASGIDSTGPYVYFPYGWWPSGGNNRQYCRLTAAQAVAACPSQTKSASPSTSAQTISADSGKLLSSVSISAISPQRSAATAATTSGAYDSTNLKGYVYFPYGWWPQVNATYGNYCVVTQAQAQAAHYHSSTATVSTRGESVDIGAFHSYRYVNTNSVPNTNSGTFTPTSNSLAHDMGATNTYRYVNTNTLYLTAYNNGYSAGIVTYQNNRSGYLEALAFTSDNVETLARCDLYDIAAGAKITITFTDGTKNNSHRIILKNQSETVLYDSGYGTFASCSYTFSAAPLTLLILLYSQYGRSVACWYHLTK